MDFEKNCKLWAMFYITESSVINDVVENDNKIIG